MVRDLACRGAFHATVSSRPGYAEVVRDRSQGPARLVHRGRGDHVEVGQDPVAQLDAGPLQLREDRRPADVQCLGQGVGSLTGQVALTRPRFGRNRTRSGAEPATQLEPTRLAACAARDAGDAPTSTIARVPGSAVRRCHLADLVERVRSTVANRSNAWRQRGGQRLDQVACDPGHRIRRQLAAARAWLSRVILGIGRAGRAPRRGRSRPRRPSNRRSKGCRSPWHTTGRVNDGSSCATPQPVAVDRTSSLVRHSGQHRRAPRGCQAGRARTLGQTRATI